jgi:hypothetical protein
VLLQGRGGIQKIALFGKRSSPYYGKDSSNKQSKTWSLEFVTVTMWAYYSIIDTTSGDFPWSSMYCRRTPYLLTTVVYLVSVIEQVTCSRGSQLFIDGHNSLSLKLLGFYKCFCEKNRFGIRPYLTHRKNNTLAQPWLITQTNATTQQAVFHTHGLKSSKTRWRYRGAQEVTYTSPTPAFICSK